MTKGLEMTRAEYILEKYSTAFIRDPAGEVEKRVRQGADVAQKAGSAVKDFAQQNPALAAGGAVALGGAALLARRMRKRKMKQRAGLSSSGGTGIT